MLQTRNNRLCSLAIFAGVYFLLFLLHYEISLFIESDLAVEIVSYFVYLLVASATAVGAVLFMGLYREMGAGAHLWLLYFTLTRLAYQIPYYYIYYITEYYTSAEALLYGAIMSLFELAIYYGVYALVAFIVRRVAKGDMAEASVFPLSLVLVAYELLTLIYEFVLYLISYRGEIFLEDAPYFIFGFIYCALILCCSYFGGTLLLSRLFQKDSTQPKEI
jgi:hypothetical protein